MIKKKKKRKDEVFGRHHKIKVSLIFIEIPRIMGGFITSIAIICFLYILFILFLFLFFKSKFTQKNQHFFTAFLFSILFLYILNVFFSSVLVCSVLFDFVIFFLFFADFVLLKLHFYCRKLFFYFYCNSTHIHTHTHTYSVQIEEPSQVTQLVS